ncbi:HAD family hydrolase [Rubrolithibacter danxiaensis]|uniref:HAD family hydrolase n=1 Tax=Rubrolithibacter danxiaensis TaxID=3390805 RepID=UPI003BF89145
MLTLILDLDNTIYPVSSIADELFSPLFSLLADSRFKLEHSVIDDAKQDIMRIPFQKVSAKYNFPHQLTEEAMTLLRNAVFEKKMTYYDDYNFIRELKARKFLLTTGFLKLQQSKIKCLGIESDFEEICIVDPDRSSDTKKDIMERLIDKYRFNPEDILVVGDDPESEIKAASELGLKSFLLDKTGRYDDIKTATFKGKSLEEVGFILKA